MHHSDRSRRSDGDDAAELKPVRMNWVVVTDDDGNRRLRICWRAERN